jgi:hypothetical protein
VFLVAAMTVVSLAPPPEDVTVQPVESYDSSDLRRAAAALEALTATRLTPQERETVADTAEVLDRLATGQATISPVSTTVPAATPAPTTVAPTTVAPTTVPRLDPNRLADLFSDSYPPAPTTVP